MSNNEVKKESYATSMLDIQNLMFDIFSLPSFPLAEERENKRSDVRVSYFPVAVSIPVVVPTRVGCVHPRGCVLTATFKAVQ